MFKFARYFFAVFLITTIVPLLLMFSWNHSQMEKMVFEKKHHFLNIGNEELKKSIAQYLRIKESFVLEKVLNLSSESLSEDKLKHIFNTDKVAFVKDKSLSKVNSYYCALPANSEHKELYSTFIIPYKYGNYDGLKITEKVDLNQLHPNGPFVIEIYTGDKVNKQNFSQVVLDPLIKHDDFIKNDLKKRFGITPDANKPPRRMPDRGFAQESNNVNIIDNNGKVIAILVIKHVDMPERMFMPPPPGVRQNFGPPMPFDAPLNPENQLGLVILLAGSILSLLIGFYLNKTFVNPLILLSDALKKVQQGDLSFELDTKINQEQIMNIFKDFNKMVRGLKEKEILRKSFVTNLTHDLKTPLIAQERSLGMIAEEFEALNLKHPYELAKGLEKSNNHLLRMVNMILESYKFDSEKLDLNFTKINLEELVNNCYEKLNALALEKNTEFINKIPKDFFEIEADPTSLKRIFVNLISNSIDNINKNGKIQISAEDKDDFVEICVEDNGAGISKEDISSVFDHYYTGKSGDRKIGSGLGLYVCKKLVEIHKGEIFVESELNNFTKFTIILPKKH